MKLVGRVPVEPLSDERITNIERAIVAGAADAAAKGRARESKWPVFGFAMATLVLVIGAGFVGWRMRGGGEVSPSAESAPLAVATDASSTTIDIGDAKVTSDPATKFVVTRAGSGVLITMARGKVLLDVVKRGGKDPLIVRAGDTDVEVVGTQFSVDYGDGTGDVDVRVIEGKVKVTRRSQPEPTLVAGGEAWETTRGKIALADARVAKAIVIPAEPAKDGGKEIGLHDRTAKVPDARISMNGSGSAKSSIVQGGPEVVRPRTPDATSTRLDYLPAIMQQSVEPALDVKLPPPQAVAEYRKMAAFGARGQEASKAFYSIAVVQHLKLGRDADAMQTLDQYFRRFRPDANEYLAARWLDVRIKCTRRDTTGLFKLALNDRCRQAAYTYAHTAPESPQRTLATSLSTASGD